MDRKLQQPYSIKLSIYCKYGQLNNFMTFRDHVTALNSYIHKYMWVRLWRVLKPFRRLTLTTFLLAHSTKWNIGWRRRLLSHVLICISIVHPSTVGHANSLSNEDGAKQYCLGIDCYLIFDKITNRTNVVMKRSVPGINESIDWEKKSFLPPVVIVF